MNTNGMYVHHVGVLVHDIDAYLEQSWWVLRSPTVYDPTQQARLCLVSLEYDETHLVELIEPAGEESPTYRALASGQRQHHLCFAVPDPAFADQILRDYRMLPVTPWQAATLFDDRSVRFAYTRNRELVEFVVDEHAEE